MCDNTKNGRTLAPNHEKAKPPRKKIPHACKRGQKVGRGVGVSQLKNIPPPPPPPTVGVCLRACRRLPLAFRLWSWVCPVSRNGEIRREYVADNIQYRHGRNNAKYGQIPPFYRRFISFANILYGNRNGRGLTVYPVPTFRRSLRG